MPHAELGSLQQVGHAAGWVLQLIKLDPQLAIPAALPLIAARLMDAGGIDESGIGTEDLEPSPRCLAPEVE